MRGDYISGRPTVAQVKAIQDELSDAEILAHADRFSALGVRQGGGLGRKLALIAEDFRRLVAERHLEAPPAPESAPTTTEPDADDPVPGDIAEPIEVTPDVLTEAQRQLLAMSDSDFERQNKNWLIRACETIGADAPDGATNAELRALVQPWRERHGVSK